MQTAATNCAYEIVDYRSPAQSRRRRNPFLMQQPPGAPPQSYKLQGDVFRPYTLDPP